tara:strand:- start:9716 stop:11992 length:2277 start_codon:yes stop_codon:yes gene_type:complete
MGIEKFFNSLRIKYNKSNLIIDTKYPYQKISSKYIFFDFNSIIHNISQKILATNITENIDQTIINGVLDDVIFILKNNFVAKDIKLIYLSIDGTPSKAKIVEQRKRRYLGAIESLISQNLLPNKTSLWSKNNISPATNFMEQLIINLKSDKFKNKLNTINTNIKYILSDTNEFGEGEKKIIDYIIENDIYENITIFSPDADMILLALLLLKKSNNINILRRDQQASEKLDDDNIFHFAYNIIDIDSLGKTLLSYLKNKSEDIKYYNLINDIILLFTFFGDDFLPKLESYNVNNDIDLILNTYFTIYNKTKQYLITNYKINLNFLKNLIKELAKNEKNILERNYIMNIFHNYNRVKKDVEKFIKKKLNHENLIKWIKLYNFYRLLDNIKDKLLQLKNKNEDEIINYIKLNLNKFYNFGSSEIYFPTLIEIDKIINSYVYHNSLIKKDKDDKVNLLLHFIINNKFPDFNNFYSINSKFRSKNNYLIFEKRDYTSNNYYHKNNLKNLDKNSQIMYKFNNMIDNYYNKLNKENKIQLGNTLNINDSISKYYKFYFNNKSKDLIIKEYLEGLYWINEYYFNDRIANKWFYKNFKSPLLIDIDKFFDNNNFSFDYIEKKYDFSGRPTFTPLEQLIYITPFNIKNLDNDKNFKMLSYLGKDNLYKIKQFLQNKKINKIYFDNENIVNNIINNNNNHIYCFDAFYFNKCYLKEEEILYDFNDDEFIKEFRNLIKPEYQKFNLNIIDTGLLYNLYKNNNINKINHFF